MTQTQRCSFRMNLSIVLIEASLLAYIYIYIGYIYITKKLFLKLTQINVIDFREKLMNREWIGVKVASSCYIQEFNSLKKKFINFLKFTFILSIRKI